MQFLPNVEEIKILEISERIAAKQDKDGNHPHIAHSPPSIITLWAIGKGGWKRVFIPFQCIFFAVIVWNTKHFCNFVLGDHSNFCLCLFVYQHLNVTISFANHQIYRHL